jgi:hypothetical protein
MRVTNTIKGALGGVFESIEEERHIILDGNSLDPLDVGATDKYIIPAGTPVCPVVGTAKYLPIRRTHAAAAVSNDTTLTVDNAKPFADGVGKGILFFASIAATAELRTISAVDTTTNVITLSAAATVVDDDFVEMALNGVHGNTENATPTQIPDAVILAETVEVYHQGSTFDTPAVGVIKGVISRGKVNSGTGAGAATFDVALKTQLPGISFLPINPGTA